MDQDRDQHDINRGLSGYAGTVTGIPVTMSKDKWQAIATFVQDHKDEIERDTPRTTEEEALYDLFTQLEVAGIKVIDIGQVAGED